MKAPALLHVSFENKDFLTPKEPAAFFLIHTRTTSTALKKFVSKMHSKEYKQVHAYVVFCVLMFTTLNLKRSKGEGKRKKSILSFTRT